MAWNIKEDDDASELAWPVSLDLIPQINETDSDIVLAPHSENSPSLKNFNMLADENSLQQPTKSKDSAHSENDFNGINLTPTRYSGDKLVPSPNSKTQVDSKENSRDGYSCYERMQFKYQANDLKLEQTTETRKTALEIQLHNQDTLAAFTQSEKRIADLEKQLLDEQHEQEKWKSVALMLKQSEVDKIEQARKLSANLQQLCLREKELESQTCVYLSQREKDADARVAIAQGKINQLNNTIDTLNQRILYLEECLSKRDQDIAKARDIVRQSESQGLNVQQKSQEVVIKLQMTQNQVQDLQREIRDLKIRHEKKLQEANENFEQQRQLQASQHSKSISNLQKQQQQWENKYQDLVQDSSKRYSNINNLQKLLTQKGIEIERLRKEIVHLEASLHAADRTSEIKMLRNRENEYQQQISDLLKRISVLDEDSLLLEKTRKECMNLHTLTQELKRVIHRQEQTIQVYKAQMSNK